MLMQMNIFHMLKAWKTNHIENRNYGDIMSGKIDDRDFLGYDARDGIDYTEIYEQLVDSTKNRLYNSGNNNIQTSSNLYSKQQPSGITPQGQFIQIM